MIRVTPDATAKAPGSGVRKRVVASEAEEERRDLAGSVVHIVDDDAGVRLALTMIVEAAGHPVRAYATAEAFLAENSEHLAGCLVTDVRMPGMSGMELLRRLGALAPDLPVLVITGHGD